MRNYLHYNETIRLWNFSQTTFAKDSESKLIQLNGLEMQSWAAAANSLFAGKTAVSYSPFSDECQRRYNSLLMRVRLLTWHSTRIYPAIYTCCQEIQDPWPLAPRLGAKLCPRLWDTFNIGWVGRAFGCGEASRAIRVVIYLQRFLGYRKRRAEWLWRSRQPS